MNDCKNVWSRIVSNSGKIELRTIRNLRLQYKVEGNEVVWIGLEKSMNNLFPQSKENICACLESRRRELQPSKYPGTKEVSHLKQIIELCIHWIEAEIATKKLIKEMPN